MLLSPWFERVWTCQEAAFAQRATVHYGPITCDWKLFSDAVMDSNFELLSAEGSESLKDLYSFRKACKKAVLNRNIISEGSSDYLIDDVLNGLRHTKATNPKDKVFGIHAILQRLGIRLSAPDYSKSVGQIFGEASLAIHRRRRFLRLRHYFDPLDNPHCLPSWVPDWSKLHYPVFYERSSFSIFNAAPGSTFSPGSRLITLFYPSNQLRIKARIIDTVAKSGLIFPQDAHDLSTQEITSVLNTWMEMATDVKANVHVDYAYTEVKDLHLLSVMLLLRNPSLYNRVNSLNFVAWLQDEKRTNNIDGVYHKTDGEPESISPFEFENYIRPSWEGQMVFRSESKKLGLGGGITNAGDLVVLAAGCDMPLVVRKSGEFCTCIGPAYLPHAMNGELWVESEDFLIDMTLV